MSLLEIWILKDSGTCLFHRKYDNSMNDENLISGFLSAVNSFVGSFGVELQWIETNRSRFVFKISEPIIFVAATNKNEHAPLTYKRLERIADHFHYMFKRELTETNEPIPIDNFNKIATTVNRIFGIMQEVEKPIYTPPVIANRAEMKFDSAEARLLSFIRYKRRVNVSDIVRFLKISDQEAEQVLNILENKRFIQRTEHVDGSENFGIHPIVRNAF